MFERGWWNNGRKCNKLSGVVTGAYFTTKFCNELIDQFTDYYKKNADKIASSYQEAIEYFDDVLK